MQDQAKYSRISEIIGIAKQPKRMSVPKVVDNFSKNLTNLGNGGIIKADIKIGRSLGASVKKDIVLLPNGNKGRLKENSTITKIVTFAGAGTNKPIRIANNLSRIYKEYNVSPSEWQKTRGDGYVVCDDGITRHAELHWYYSKKTGRVEIKVKRYFDD